MRSIGVMGGTFDPPHFGHLAAAEEVLHRLGLDSILWIPAGLPPHKLQSPVTPAHHRVEMLRRALEGNVGFELSTVETERERPSYTVETLARLRERRPDDRLVFLMGSDQFASLARIWSRPELLPQLAELAVMVRSGVSFDPRVIEAALPGVVGRYQLVPVADLPLSSTGLRRRVREGLPIRYLVPEEVREYIEEHGLYR